jgi:hypothetical protein
MHRILSIHRLQHPLVKSIRFTSSGHQINVELHSQPDGDTGLIRCDRIFHTDSLVLMGAVECMVSNGSLIVSSSKLSAVVPGDTIYIKSGALKSGVLDAAGRFFVSNSLTPEPCGAVFVSTASDQCSAGSVELLQSSASFQAKRPPTFLWDVLIQQQGATAAMCRLRTHLAAVKGPVIRTDTFDPQYVEMLESVELVGSCINFMGQYGHPQSTSVSPHAAFLPTPKISLPKLMSVIAGFDFALLGSVTRPQMVASECGPPEEEYLSRVASW